MNNPKPWYLSRGVVGGLVAAVLPLLGLFGVSLSAEDQLQLVNVIVALATSVAGVVAIVGRLKADRPIGKADDGFPAGFGHGLAVLLIAVTMVGSLSACAVQQAETPAQRVFALQGQLNGLLATVDHYVHSPDAAARPEVKEALQRATVTAVAAVKSAQAAVRSGRDPAIPAALAAAGAAVAELSAAIAKHNLLEEN